MIQELKHLTWRQGLISLFVFLGSLAPGALVLFVFDRELFMALDTFKLVLLSLAITLPISLINIFCASVFSEALDKEWHSEAKSDDEQKEKLLTAETAVSFWITSAVYYTALGVSVFKSQGIQSFATNVFIAECIVVLAAVFTAGKLKWKARKEDKTAVVD
ncbi:hypothetical protein [Neptuniibacter sp.]|uniref:hypothetical protein n=1 Tax=Neptuniibacter sp. TaxID=1962643 RepID=UPI0026187F3D|nr:hypothetical protein [Neptuniibacter sp.]MCP4597197.1 hypothetical protein [Neptuniibacter sp.]